MSSKIWLSKSTYLKGLQCPKSLYLHKKHYLERDAVDPKLQALFDDGHDIEQLARQRLFAGGMNLKPKSPKQWAKVILMTKQLILNQQPLLYEAAFAFKGVMCAVDVLRLEPNQQLSIFEIKRSKKIKDVFMNDMALQYWIITNLGYKIQQISLVQPKESSEIEFSVTDCTDEIIQRQESIPKTLNQQFQLLHNSSIPEIFMGDQCYSPYRCSFIGFCSKQEMAG